MGRMLGASLAALTALAVLAGEVVARSVHDLRFTSIDGAPLPLADFAGRALLVVNTASLCGFTYQYDALQSLWETYRERGLVVLGVPSGDFGNQELGSAEEIKEFCEVNFALDFPLTEKQTVRGDEAHPFFIQAVEELGSEAAPRWNFHKYLVDPGGHLVGTWPSRVEPNAPELIDAIETVLPQ